MSETKSIALASTLALGPPRSWVDGCAAWVDSRGEQCGKPRTEGYLCARHHKVAERHLEKKQEAEKRQRKHQDRLDRIKEGNEMTDKHAEIIALIEANDLASKRYADANTALEEAVRAGIKEADPQLGEVWEIIETHALCPHEPIPAIMGEMQWHVAPFHTGGSSTLHIGSAYPLKLIAEAPNTDCREN